MFNLKFVNGLCPDDPDTIGECYKITWEIRIYRGHPCCHGKDLITTIVHELGHQFIFRFGNWSDDTHLLYDCLFSDLFNLFRRKKTCFFLKFIKDMNVQKIVNETSKGLEIDLPLAREKTDK